MEGLPFQKISKRTPGKRVVLNITKVFNPLICKRNVETSESSVEKFKEFIEIAYNDELKRVLSNYPKIKSLNIDLNAVEKFDLDLAEEIIKKPDEMISAAEKAIKEMELETPSGEEFAPHVRFYNVNMEDVLIEDINSAYLNKLITFKGIITRRGEVLHKVKVVQLKCMVCGETIKFPIVREYKKPSTCPYCKKGKLKEDIDASKFVDVQVAEIQDLLEKIRGGAPSSRILLVFEDDLINSVVPGDNVEITGILRINLERRRSKIELIFSKFVDVVNVVKMQKEFEELEITKEDEKRILELAKDPRVEEKIIESIAPDIWGYKEIKRAIALQLFGGTKGKKTKSGTLLRDDIHILLVGDPGLAKTRFLSGAIKIAPKSMYVSGKSVSGVGLTAAAEKDEISGGGWTLKAGALVLASGGICAIDEFDKIDDEDRASLHEVMESGTVSVAKAGIVARFRAKTSILAAANPKFGRFQMNRGIADQFNIPPSLLSRFDLIFPIIDVLDVDKDTALAEHILDLHMQKTKEEEIEVIDAELLRKYIAYARKNIKPVLSEEAAEIIKNFYVDLRKLGQQTGSVPITPRYLEGLVRLAEANAKLRLSDVVEAKDGEAAVALMSYVMDKVMRDRETGALDADVIATGRSKSERSKTIEIVDIINHLSKKYDEVEISMVIEEAENIGIDEQTVMRVIRELERSGEIYKPKPNTIKMVERD